MSYHAALEAVFLTTVTDDIPKHLAWRCTLTGELTLGFRAPSNVWVAIS